MQSVTRQRGEVMPNPMAQRAAYTGANVTQPRTAIAALCGALLLAGCSTFPASKVTATLPDVPAEVRTCFDQLVPAPAPGALTQKQIVHLVAQLRQSEQSKSACGRRLLAFYDAEKEVLGK
jgi:hypothetical protein